MEPELPDSTITERHYPNRPSLSVPDPANKILLLDVAAFLLLWQGEYRTSQYYFKFSQ